MSLIIVLQRPQNLVNVAVIIRAMKNFGLQDLRLVAPVEEFDRYRVEGIAHNTGDIIDRVRVFEDLDDALGDCIHVAGMTARHRTVKRNVQRAEDAATELVELASEGNAAVLLGPEDAGLSNAELDRCSRIVTIDTSPEHPSLNLAQALTIMAYELFRATGRRRPFKRPRRTAPPAEHAEIERLFGDVRQALDSVEFFKSKSEENIMRTVREIVHRTPLDAREVKLLRAMALEVGHFIRRKVAS